MFWLLALAVLVLAVRADELDDSCTLNTWSYNSKGASPCALWQDLSALCTPSSSLTTTVTHLHTIAAEYIPPSKQDATRCVCNVVTFNLASACALCQPSFNSADLLTENDWKSNCTTYNSTGVYPATAKETLDLPAWSFLAERGGTFQATLAQELAGSDAAATFTASGTTSAAGTASSAAASTTPSHKKTDIGAIVGGVVGGVGGLIATGAIAWMLLRYRSLQRNKTALVSPREPPPEKEFGLPADIKVQHFVPPPPSSGHSGSYDQLPPPGVAISAHPFAANYAVQRNMTAETARSYTSSSNYEALPGQTIMPFDTQSVAGTLSSGPNTADIFPSSPYASGLSSLGSVSLARAHSTSTATTSHPYANPVVHDQYQRTLPEPPITRRSPAPQWSADVQLPPTQSPTRQLPPLRVPQPVRHVSTSAADFSASSWSSSAPLVAHSPQQLHHAPRQSSIDDVLGAPPQPGGRGKQPRTQAPSAWLD